TAYSYTQPDRRVCVDPCGQVVERPLLEIVSVGALKSCGFILAVDQGRQMVDRLVIQGAFQQKRAGQAACPTIVASNGYFAKKQRWTIRLPRPAAQVSKSSAWALSWRISCTWPAPV